jgi:hypothetical protein
LEETPLVEPLRRVRLAVEAGAAATDPSPVCAEAAFIYGIGPAGLLPFECLLAGKREGDTISFQVTKAGAPDFFGHLAELFPASFDPRGEAFFRTRVLRVESPEPREVVKAIAELTARGHGGGCDCGCGCG